MPKTGIVSQGSSVELWDALVIGAGPSGLASAIEAQRAGLRVISVDKGCLVNSLFHYPANMLFFTTPELLEIGDIPFPSAHPKPTREEALEYYRKVAEHYRLDIRQYERVEQVSGSDGGFEEWKAKTYSAPSTSLTTKSVTPAPIINPSPRTFPSMEMNPSRNVPSDSVLVSNSVLRNMASIAWPTRAAISGFVTRTQKRPVRLGRPTDSFQ